MKIFELDQGRRLRLRVDVHGRGGLHCEGSATLRRWRLIGMRACPGGRQRLWFKGWDQICSESRFLKSEHKQDIEE